MLDHLINNVSNKNIQDFFRRKVSAFQPMQEDISESIPANGYDQFTALTKLGEIEYNNSDELLVFSCQYDGELSERSSKKKQFDIAKRVLRDDFKDGAVFVFFDKKSKFRFSFIRKFYGEDKKYSNWKRYTYFVHADQSNRTFRQQIEKCQFSSLAEIQEAFSLEALNKQFYIDYQNISKKLIRYIYTSQIDNKLKAHQGVLNLLNRMIFVYFIQKKGWLMNQMSFLHNFWKDYKQHSKDADTFHEHWLNKVFFQAFNGNAYKDPEIFKTLPSKYHTAILDFPYLNGGLFTRHEEFDNFIIGDDLFAEIFDFLQNYNFTIIEDEEEDVSLEINPELLGKMYEGMINATDLDDVDAEHGIVYTERPEINFMTRRSMVEVLQQKLSDEYSRAFLYHFCFDKPIEKVELLKRYEPNAQELTQAITSVTALDPSCGSGSMLIGFIQLQVELLKCVKEYSKQSISNKEEFELKKQIISESIYGVDVKEWAVRIAELRFWLYMIADVELSTKELTEKPLLPNLDFKLRQGNSLIQEIGNIDFSIAGLFKGRNKNTGATRKLNDFIRKKKKFITNQSEVKTSFKALKEQELYVFRTFIQEVIHENNLQIRQLSKGSGQTSLFGDEKKGTLFEGKIKALENENDQLHKILRSIKKTGRLPFSYDIDFMEIFITKKDPGFDLIIGNPPYVRQEDILPADDPIEVERLLQKKYKAEKAKVNNAYKSKLSKKVYNTYPFLKTSARTKVNGKNKTIDIYGKKVPGRSDLYVYFQLLCPSLLNSKGTFCFIISNSWLDVGFGGYVQHFLLKHTKLHAIYDCQVRSFSASVNTVIYLHSAIINNNLTLNQYKTFRPSGEPIRFVLNKEDYTQTAYAPLLLEQENTRKDTFRKRYRVIQRTPQELWKEGYNEESLKYDSDKWGGKYLKAPEIYYTILERAKDKIVAIKNLAEVKYGIKTGANDYFILKKSLAKKHQLEQKYLKPIIRSSKEVTTLVEPESIENVLVYISKEPQKHEKGILSYIKHGENPNLWDDNPPATRASCKGREYWYMVGQKRIPDIACNYMIDTIMKFFAYNAFVVDNFHELHLNKDIIKNDAIRCLNSTLFSLFFNIVSRGNFGDGLAKIQKYEVAELSTLHPKHIKDKIKDLKFLKRKQSNIFEELGLDRNLPIRSQIPNPKSDRKEIDDIIFDEIGLTKAERQEVYLATAELVKQRLDKAKSRK